MRRTFGGATVARLPRSAPADGRIREALIEEAERIQNYMDRLGAGEYGRLVALRTGDAVAVRWWELPNPVKDSMPTPYDINELWTLVADDVLGRSRSQ